MKIYNAYQRKKHGSAHSSTSLNWKSAWVNERKNSILFCSNLCLIHGLFDELMGFNMNLIWGQEEVTQGEQGMTEHFGPAGGRDEDSLGQEEQDFTLLSFM